MTDRHRSSTWIAALAVLALGAIGWLALRGGGDADTAAERGAAAPMLAAERDTAELIGSPAAGSPVAAPSPDARSAIPADSSAAAAKSAETLAVVVTDGATDAPVEGAEVIYLDLGPDASDDDETAVWSLDKIDEILARAGALRVVTGADGRVAVPKPTGFAAAVARHGGRFGHRVAHETSLRELPIELRPDWPLDIQVVDAAGQGLRGVPVALRTSQGTWEHDRLRATTAGPAGLARVPHAGYSIAQQEWSNGVWLAVVATALRAPLQRELDPRAPPAEPIRFEFSGDVGSVEVALFDVDGQPYLGTTEVMLGQPDATRAQGHWTWWRSPVRVRAQEGRALFPFVETGLELEVRASRAGGSGAMTTAAGPGPRTAGERAKLELRFGSEHPVIQARALGEDARPLASQDLELVLDVGAGSDTAVLRVDTDAEGRFRADLDTGWVSQGQAHVALRAGASGIASARVALPRELRPGLYELGDLQLGGAPLIAAGVVLGPGGGPIAGAQVDFSVRRYWGPDESKDENFYWDTLWQLRIQSDDEGRFALRGQVQSRHPLRIAASHPQHAGAAVECASGTSGLVLALAGAGRVAGSVVLDATLKPAALGIGADGPDAPRDGEVWSLREGYHSTPNSAGSFELGPLRAGTYTVTVRADDVDQVLAEIPGVVVVAGETTRDARLDGLDLRGKLRAITLRVLDPDGKRVPQGMVYARPGGSSAGEEEKQLWFQNGELRIPLEGASLDLRVQAGGYRPTSLEGVAADAEVRLERGLRVRLVLGSGVTLPAPPCHLMAALTPAEGGTYWDWQAPAFDERGEAAINSPGAGRMKVVWMVQRRSPHSISSTSFEPAAVQFVEVLESSAEQVFEVALDQASLDTAVAGISKQ